MEITLIDLSTDGKSVSPVFFNVSDVATGMPLLINNNGKPHEILPTENQSEYIDLIITSPGEFLLGFFSAFNSCRITYSFRVKLLLPSSYFIYLKRTMFSDLSILFYLLFYSSRCQPFVYLVDNNIKKQSDTNKSSDCCEWRSAGCRWRYFHGWCQGISDSRGIRW